MNIYELVIKIPNKIIHDRTHEFRYAGAWDSLYCLTCVEWIEPKCSCTKEDACPFDGYMRPDKPIPKQGHEIAKY